MRNSSLFTFLLWAILAFRPCNGLGQINPDLRRTYHWYFGNLGAIDFSTGNPAPVFGSSMSSNEGSASISDTCGNLLFYTNGINVWNRNNIVMPNGTGLGGGPGTSSTQQALIVSQPQNDSIYFIFTSDEGENSGINGIRYTVVNMALNGGLGDVVTKNVLLFSPCTEKLCATMHANGTDYWVVSRKLNSQDFYAYLISASGVSSTPVISQVGASKNAIGDGYMNFSHDGTKLAAAYHTGTSGDVDTVDIYDFNNTLGIISSKWSLALDTEEVYGCCFSPDDSKLYVTSQKYPPSTSYLYQYDLSSGVLVSILASKQVIDSSFNYFLGAIQVRPDKKMFVLQVSGTGTDSLATILNPNAVGTGCNFVLNDFFVGNNTCTAGLPNFVSSYFNSSWLTPCASGISQEVTDPPLGVYPNPCNSILNVEQPLASSIKITLYNAVMEEEISLEVVQRKSVLQTQYLAAGLYFLRIKSTDKESIYKIVIHH